MQPGQLDDDRSDEIMAAWRRERPDLDPASVAVITRIWHAGKLFEDERRRLLEAEGVDRAIMDLLGTLRRSGDPYALTTRDITVRSGVSAAAISQRIGRAEDNSWVTREQLAARQVLVQLTASGKKLVDSVAGRIFDHEDVLLGALSERQQRDLARLLKILITDLEFNGR